VDHVEHAAERTAETGGALAKANLTRCRTAVRKARDAIDGEDIEAAQRQVDDLYRSFPPTYS
jgi:ribosomal protein S20